MRTYRVDDGSSARKVSQAVVACGLFMDGIPT